MRRRSQYTIRRTVLLITCALVCVAADRPAASDVLLTTETRVPGEQGRPESAGRIWLGKDRMRLELRRADHPGGATIIFRADLGLYWAIDDAGRSYAQIDRVAMQRLGERVRRTRSEMVARLDELPSEQRSIAEQMIARMTPPTSSTLRERLRPTDRSGEIAGHPAQHHQMLLGDEVVGDVWTTSWSRMDLVREDFGVFTQLAAFQRELIAALGQSAGAAFGGEPFEIFDQLDGYPLQIRRLRDGAAESITSFGAANRIPESPTRFEIPKGYERRAGPGEAMSESRAADPAPQ